MKNLKKAILEVLTINSQISHSAGSCGELGDSFTSVHSDDFCVIIDQILEIIYSCVDPENQPNQYGVELLNDNNSSTFESSTEAVMNYLSKNHPPHTMIVIDSNSAQLFEGVKTHLTNKFIK
ncbi:hypothetical protein [Sphingobacterium spiritivorum]|uniref:hypothetical protein n=1 Tax=Sphingobacterium spiritivorum TaxID=258 RepID=UPI003DA47F24